MLLNNALPVSTHQEHASKQAWHLLCAVLLLLAPRASGRWEVWNSGTSGEVQHRKAAEVGVGSCGNWSLFYPCPQLINYICKWLMKEKNCIKGSSSQGHQLGVLLDFFSWRHNSVLIILQGKSSQTFCRRPPVSIVNVNSNLIHSSQLPRTWFVVFSQDSALWSYEFCLCKL